MPSHMVVTQLKNLYNTSLTVACRACTSFKISQPIDENYCSKEFLTLVHP